MTQEDAVWSRSPDVAFVDDGERVVVLRLADQGQRPQLLAGHAATVWRLLSQPRTAAELLAVASTRGDTELEPATLLPQMEAVGLCVRC